MALQLKLSKAQAKELYLRQLQRDPNKIKDVVKPASPGLPGIQPPGIQPNVPGQFTGEEPSNLNGIQDMLDGGELYDKMQGTPFDTLWRRINAGEQHDPDHKRAFVKQLVKYMKDPKQVTPEEASLFNTLKRIPKSESVDDIAQQLMGGGV